MLLMLDRVFQIIKQYLINIKLSLFLGLSKLKSSYGFYIYFFYVLPLQEFTL